MRLEWMKPAKIDVDIIARYLLFGVFFMCANLKGIVSEFEMLSDSMRVLNAGK